MIFSLGIEHLGSSKKGYTLKSLANCSPKSEGRLVYNSSSFYYPCLIISVM
jgi:hypothetical protein